MSANTEKRSYGEATMASREELDALCPLCECAMRSHLWIDDLGAGVGGPQCTAPVTLYGMKEIARQDRAWGAPWVIREGGDS